MNDNRLIEVRSARQLHALVWSSSWFTLGVVECGFTVHIVSARLITGIDVAEARGPTYLCVLCLLWSSNASTRESVSVF